MSLHIKAESVLFSSFFFVGGERKGQEDLHSIQAGSVSEEAFTIPALSPGEACLLTQARHAFNKAANSHAFIFILTS